MKRWLLVIVLGCGQHRELPDEAWGVGDYVSAGLPAPDHTWSNAELDKANEVLGRVARNRLDRLPRFHGVKSRAVFARLIERAPEDPQATGATRFELHGVRFEAAVATLQLYIPSSVSLSREPIELEGVLLHEVMAQQSLVDPFLASFGPDDPKHENRMQGLATMHKGWGEMTKGMLDTISDARISETDRRALAGYVAEVLPVLFPALPADAQQVVRQRFTALIASVPAGPLHDDLVAAQRLVR